MSAARWSAFAAGAVLLTAVLLGLSWASARSLRALGAPGEETAADAPATVDRALPTGVALAANVGLTHGLLGAVVLGLAWATAVPLSALGVADVSAGALAAGAGVGAGLYLASEAATAAADRLGLAYDEGLRSALAPRDPLGWALLLLVALPLVAAAEELLFRGVLVGALGAGLGLHVWGLAVASSLLFGLGHGAQGRVGVAVTAGLGFALAAAFVLTGSLAVVVVAHYTVDALEFVVREGFLG